MLSYAATAVVSGATGMAYLQQLYEDLPIEYAQGLAANVLVAAVRCLPGLVRVSDAW